MCWPEDLRWPMSGQMILSAPWAQLLSLKVINYALAGNHKFKPQQGHKRRNSMVLTPNTVMCACVCVCVDSLEAEMVWYVGGKWLLSWMHCFVPLCFHLGWFWSKQWKHSYGRTLFISLAKGRQCSSTVKTQPSGTRWGPDAKCAQWERKEGAGSGECSAFR